MKKLIAFLTIMFCVMPGVSLGAVNVKSSGIKKASPVATKKADKMESVTSLLPTVIGMVGAVKSLSAQQQQLSADCAPTSSEIELVNDLVKEWAMVSTTTAEAAVSGLGGPCNQDKPTDNNYSNYKTYKETFFDDPEKADCYESFSSSYDKNTVWLGFPRVSSASVCEYDDSSDCKNMSNIYDIFARIPFSKEDYTKSEAEAIAQLTAKAERCAPSKIKAAKRELYAGFVTQTLSSIGQSSGAAGTSSVLEAVSSMGGSGNVQSMLPSLGSMATQLFDK